MKEVATTFKFTTSRPCKTFLREVHPLTFIKKLGFAVQKATLRAVGQGYVEFIPNRCFDAYEVKVNKDICKYVSGEGKTNLSIPDFF